MPSVSGVDLVSGALRSTLELAQKSYSFLNSKQQSRKARRKEKKLQKKLQRQYGSRLPQPSTSTGLTSSSSIKHHHHHHKNNSFKRKLFKKNNHGSSKQISKLGSFNGTKSKFLPSSSSVNNNNNQKVNSSHLNLNKTKSLTSKSENHITQLDSSFSHEGNNSSSNSHNQNLQEHSDEDSDVFDNSNGWSPDATELLQFDSSGPQKSPFTLSLRAKYLCLNSKNSLEASPKTCTTKDNKYLSTVKNSHSNSFQNEHSAKTGSKLKASSRMNGNSINGGTATTNASVPRLAEPKHVLYKRDHVQPGWKQKMPVGGGLINLGNSCYLNATLQALLHTPAFINWLMSDDEHKKRCRNNSQFLHQCTICAMSSTMFEAFNRTNQPIRPLQIYNKLKVICKHFQHGRQEDAHEFLRYLLESMERSYLNAINGQKLDNRSKETTPLSQIFGGYLRTEVTCLQCHNVSTTFQALAELQLDIRHVATVEDAIQTHFKKERLENEGYMCEKCHTNILATKQFSLEIPPIVLCLHLKRFTPFGNKINKPIHCNRVLNLKKYLHKSHDGNDVDATYRLVGLVTHIGSSPNCGHYTAIAEAQNGQFYQFDDSCVRQTSVNGAQNSDAYVILYEIDRSKQHQTQAMCNRPSNSTTSNNFVLNKNVQNSSIKLPATTSKPSSLSAMSTSTSSSTSVVPLVSSMKVSSPPKSNSPRPEKMNGINGVNNHVKAVVHNSNGENGSSAGVQQQKMKPKTNGEVDPPQQNKFPTVGHPNDASRLKLKRPNGDIDNDSSQLKIKKPNINALATTVVVSTGGSTVSEAVAKRANSEAGTARLKVKNGPLRSYSLVPYNDDEDEEVTKEEDTKPEDSLLPKKNASKLVKPPSAINSNNYVKQFPNPWSTTRFTPKIISVKSWTEGKPSLLNNFVSNDRKKTFEKSKEELEDDEIDAGRVKKKPKQDIGQKESKPQLSFDKFTLARARNM